MGSAMRAEGKTPAPAATGRRVRPIPDLSIEAASSRLGEPREAYITILPFSPTRLGLMYPPVT